MALYRGIGGFLSSIVAGGAPLPWVLRVVTLPARAGLGAVSENRSASEAVQKSARLSNVCRGPIAGAADLLQDMDMTDESSSPVTHHEAGATPELRASHEERERAVEILGVAAGDGRLTTAELEDRVERALTARTSRELAQLTSDLPEVSGVAERAKEVVRLDFQGATGARRGQWIVPRRLEIHAVGGAVKLDFTDAVITEPNLDIEAEVRGGRLLLVTAPGIEVDVDDVAAHGGQVKMRPERGSKEPVRLRIKVSAVANGGSVIVRPHRRLWHWAHRSPES